MAKVEKSTRQINEENAKKINLELCLSYLKKREMF